MAARSSYADSGSRQPGMSTATSCASTDGFATTGALQYAALPSARWPAIINQLAVRANARTDLLPGGWEGNWLILTESPPASKTYFRSHNRTSCRQSCNSLAVRNNSPLAQRSVFLRHDFRRQTDFQTLSLARLHSPFLSRNTTPASISSRS